MRLVTNTEQRFWRTPDGAVWTPASFAYPFWTRYLEVFAPVRVVARVQEVSAVPPGSLRADGEGVEFVAIPHYQGPGQFLRVAGRVFSLLSKVVERTDVVILHLPSLLATGIVPHLRRAGHPYGVEVIADPNEAFAPGAMSHPLRALFRWWFARQQREQCRQAIAAAYVTRERLQQRYPCPAYTVGVSDIDLNDSDFCPQPRAALVAGSEEESLQLGRDRPVRLLLVGSLEQLYKGPDVLLQAIARCTTDGLNLELTLVGDGCYRPHLEQMAAALGIKERVRFRGQLPAGPPVQQELDAADLFVLPSRAEGLPKAMLEAMARGLPCIGSTAGGIPELLPPEDLVPPGDVGALAAKIREVATNPERMRFIAARNLATAQAYHARHLRPQRVAFYQYVREQTERWLSQPAQAKLA